MKVARKEMEMAVVRGLEVSNSLVAFRIVNSLEMLGMLRTLITISSS